MIREAYAGRDSFYARDEDGSPAIYLSRGDMVLMTVRCIDPQSGVLEEYAFRCWIPEAAGHLSGLSSPDDHSIRNRRIKIGDRRGLGRYRVA